MTGMGLTLGMNVEERLKGKKGAAVAGQTVA